MTFEEYIAPELMILIPVLYLIGACVKKCNSVKDNFIPIIVGAFGIIFAMMYETITMGICMESVYAGLIQGILCAGASVYANQLYKQTLDTSEDSKSLKR